jgi:hypothetical protein
MNGVSYAKMQVTQAFSLLKGTADGMTDEQYNFNPGGTCNPAAKNHVHSLTAVDFFVLNKAQGSKMLWPEFAPKHGLPANSTEIWAFDGIIPLAPIKEFGAEIQKATMEYVDTLTDADLDRTVETGVFGTQTVAFLIQLAAMHAVGHTGDIAAVKGLQGLKGLPF